MVYAIRVEEIHTQTFLVEADDLESAIEKVEEFDKEEGLYLEEISEMNFNPSPDAKANGEATEEQIRYCEWLHI